MLGTNRDGDKKTMTSDVTIYYDDYGMPVGLSGRIDKNTDKKAYWAKLRSLGVD